MNFWVGFALVVAASALVFVAVSINGKSEEAGGHVDGGHGAHGH